MEKEEAIGRYRIYKLAEDERIVSFDCGDEDLNDFALNEAQPYRKEKLAVTYTLVNKEDDSDVGAYFCLLNDRISMTDFDNKTEYNRFRKRFVNAKRIKSYPAAKIGRFAVAKSMKGKNIGSFLLDFIKSFFVIDNKTGCRFLTVDAYADAVPFYLKNGFVPLNDEDKDEDTRLLYFDLNDISGQ